MRLNSQLKHSKALPKVTVQKNCLSHKIAKIPDREENRNNNMDIIQSSTWANWNSQVINTKTMNFKKYLISQKP